MYRNLSQKLLTAEAAGGAENRLHGSAISASSAVKCFWRLGGQSTQPVALGIRR
jgi:hypothetical protein